MKILILTWTMVINFYGPGICVSQCVTTKISNPNGHFSITGLVPVMSSVPSRFRSIGVLFSEAMRFSIADVNQNILSYDGQLGYEVYDTCGEEYLLGTTEVITNTILPKFQLNTSSCTCIQKNPPFIHIGILGSYHSSKSIHINRLLRNEPTVVVSYISTSTELSKKELYPNFYRTISPDGDYVKILGDMVTHLNWPYVSVIATDNTFGFTGRLELLKEFGKRNICVNLDELIGVPYDMNEIRTTVHLLKKHHRKTMNSNVVILFMVEEAGYLILKYAEEIQLYGITWFFVDASGVSSWVETIHPKVVSGMVTLAFYAGKYQSFEKYFYNLSLSNNNGNRWVNQFLTMQNAHSLSEFRNMFETSMPYVGFIRDAVYVMGVALKNYLHDYDIHKFDKSMFSQKYIPNVTFQTLSGDWFRFNEFGDTQTASMLIYNTQYENKKFSIKKVGTWTAARGLNITEKLSWPYGHNGNNPLKCLWNCPPGEYPSINIGNQCCWICLPCKPGYVKATSGNYMCQKCEDKMTNRKQTNCMIFEWIGTSYYRALINVMFIMIVFGVLVSGLVIFTLVKFRETPIVKSTNCRLSVFQVTIQMMLFLGLILFYIDISIGYCIARMLLFDCGLSLTISILFVKSEQLLHVFKSQIRMNGKDILIFKTMGGMMILITSLIGLSLASIAMLIKPVDFQTYYHLEINRKEKACRTDLNVVMQVIYLFILSLVCGIQAFRSRSLPQRYNDSQCIMFSAISNIIFLSILLLSQKFSTYHYVKRFFIFLTIYGLNMVTLCLMYGLKLWAIWFHPEQNTLKVFRNARFHSVLKVSDCKKVMKVNNC